MSSRSAMFLSDLGRRLIRRPRESTAAWLVRRGVSANALTIAGTLVTLAPAVALAYRQWWLAALLLALAGTFDILDGEVARQTRRTRFGGFLDSTLDRYADLALYAGLGVAYYARPWVLAVLFAAAVGSIMTSYTRARAESEMEGFRCGFFERADRILVLMAGCLLHWVPAALLIIAVLSNLTALQRILYTRKRLRGD